MLDQTERISALLPSVNVSCVFRFILPYWSARDPHLPLTSNIFLSSILEIFHILTPVLRGSLSGIFSPYFEREKTRSLFFSPPSKKKNTDGLTSHNCLPSTSQHFLTTMNFFTTFSYIFPVNNDFTLERSESGASLKLLAYFFWYLISY